MRGGCHNNEAKFQQLQKKEIDMRDTALDRLLEMKKREYDAVVAKMNKEDALCRKLDKLDKKGEF